MNTKKLFLLTLLIIPGSMCGMLRNTSRLTRLTKRLSMPSQTVRKNVQRFLVTGRKALGNVRNSNQLTMRVLPISQNLQKRVRRFLATRGARKNNSVTKGMVPFTRNIQRIEQGYISEKNNQLTRYMLPLLIQKRFVHNNENDEKESFVKDFVVSTLMVAGVFIGIWIFFGGIGIMLLADSIPEFFVGAAIAAVPVSIVYHADA